jgi:hypothetical protein
VSEDGIDWGEVRLGPETTGLPVSVWLTEGNGRLRVRVAVEVTPDADLMAVARWIEANKALIFDLWDGSVDWDDIAPRLIRVDVF